MFTNLNKEGRVEAIDFLKLYASVLVVLGHTMMKYISQGTSNPLFNFIWLTQMPLFMFASGFVNTKSLKVNTIKKYLLKLLRCALLLLVPCLSFLLLSCLITGGSVGNAFIAFYKNPESNLWFLWVLFLIHFIFDFGLYLSSKIKKFIGTFIPVFIALFISFSIALLMVAFKSKLDFSILSIKLLAYYLPFYCFGYLFYIALNRGFFNIKIVKILSWMVLVLCLACLLFECFFFESIYYFDDTNIKYLIIRVVGSVSSILVSVFTIDLIIRFKLICTVSKYGAFSLQSYYLHIVFLKLLNYSSDLVIAQWAISFGTAALLILIVIVSLIVVYFIPYAHLILFGKSWSHYKFEKHLPNVFR